MRFCYTSKIRFRSGDIVQGRWFFVPPHIWDGLPYNPQCEAWIWEKDRDWETADYEIPASYLWTRPPAGGFLDGLIERWRDLCVETGTGGPGGIEGSLVGGGPGGGATVTLPATTGQVWFPRTGWDALIRAALGDCDDYTVEAGLLESDPGDGPNFDIDDILDREATYPDYTRKPITVTRGDGVDPSLVFSGACWTPPPTWAGRALYGAFFVAIYSGPIGGNQLLYVVLTSRVPIPFAIGVANCFNPTVELRGFPLLPE